MEGVQGAQASFQQDKWVGRPDAEPWNGLQASAVVHVKTNESLRCQQNKMEAGNICDDMLEELG